MISAAIPAPRRISRRSRRCSTSMPRPGCCRSSTSRSSSTRPSSLRCNKRSIRSSSRRTPGPINAEPGCRHRSRNLLSLLTPVGMGPGVRRDDLMKKLRSRVTTDGLDRAPHRAFMRAMGLDDADIAKPFVGVVSMKGEQTPCNMTHDFQVDAAKAGIAEAGGTPREFSTISVSDGISMNHEGMKFSLLSRELIADSIEAVVHGLAYDALIGFGGCDKTLPGVMMGMVRCNVPSIFIYGGSALPGSFRGKTLTVLDSYEAVGGFMTGEIDEATLDGIERACLPTIGACAGQFTANTMAMVSEAMGLTMPNVSMVPGVYAERAQIARRAGRLVIELLQPGGPLPRETVTRKALENGAAIVAATGGSTNAALHLPALANE